MTIWPAYHHFEDKTKGSLEPGKLVDFAILEPGARADGGVPDITPLLVAFGGHCGPLDGCAHDAMFRMTAAMAGGQAGR